MLCLVLRQDDRTGSHSCKQLSLPPRKKFPFLSLQETNDSFTRVTNLLICNGMIMILYPCLPELCKPMLTINTDWELPKPACLVPAPHLPITALHRASTVNQVIWLNQLNYLLGEGGRRVSVIQPNSKRRSRRGRGWEEGKVY